MVKKKKYRQVLENSERETKEIYFCIFVMLTVFCYIAYVYRVSPKKCSHGFLTITPDTGILHFGHLGAEKNEFKVGFLGGRYFNFRYPKYFISFLLLSDDIKNIKYLKKISF